MGSNKKSDVQEVLKLCKGSFIVAGFFSLFINFLMLVPSIYMLQLYDRVISSGNESTLIMLTLIMVVLFITMGLLEWVRSQILVRVSSRIEMLLNHRLFAVTFKQALLSGGLKSSSQPLDDLTSLRQFLTGNGLFAFFDAPWMPIYIAVMFMFHPWYGWMAIGTAIILIVFAIINEKVTSKPLQQANGLAISGRGLLNKNLRNAEVVDSMGMLDGIRQRWLVTSNNVMSLQAQASTKAGMITSLTKTTRLLSQSLILGLGAYLVLDQQITPGLMIAGSILLGRALAPIDLMIGSWKGFIAARGQYQRLNELLIKIPKDEEKMQLPDPVGKMVVENIIVSPPGSGTPVVNGVNFTLNAGDSLGIIGPSAAGKSTLARALLGIWPSYRGKVRLDGVDIYEWNRAELGPFIGYLPQDIELFEGTISENISRFGNVDPDEVVAAAKLAGVHEMILGLPDGYDTTIGASGGALSGGQRQRVGLARGVYGSPKFVLLDEPNSNLDDQGEQALAKALTTLKEKKTTVVIVSHRLGVLSMLDNLLIMKEGQQVAFGPTQEVLKQIQNTVPTSTQKTKSIAPNTVPPVI